KRFDIKLGDTLTLDGDIYPGRWDFTVSAIYTVQRPGDDDTWMLFHWNYLNERVKAERPEGGDQVGWFVLKIDDPSKAASIAKTVDGMFENSPAQTLTETEASFQMGFVKMMGNIQFILGFIGVGVFFCMAFVALNTMMMSARERTTEIGVLKSMGFTGS